MIVELGICKMMAESTPISDDPVNPGEFEVKESTGGGKSIWDEEW